MTQLELDSQSPRLFDSLLRDMRYGIRMMARYRGFSLVVVMTLALGIGASTAVFSAVYSILIKPLPYPQAGQIMFPWRQAPPGMNLGYAEIPWGRVDFLFFASQTQAFEHLAAFKSDAVNLTGAGDPARIPVLRASAGFFPALGVSPAIGRTFTPEEDQQGQDNVVVLSHQLWSDRFNRDPGIVGKSIALDGRSCTVIGVMPAGFDFPRGAEMPEGLTLAAKVDMWTPLALSTGALIPGEDSQLAVVGRVRPGVTIQQAQADMDVLSSRLEAQYPPSGKDWFHSRVRLLSNQVTGTTARPLLLILSAMAVVLLIACFNVANLLIARSLDRQREFSLRAALGAGRRRLISQLMVENLTLAILGGLAGLLIAQLGIGFVRAYGPASLPRLRGVQLDPAVFAFALGVSLLTGLLFGLLPAVSASRTNLAECLRESGQRTGASPAAARIRNGLLISQVALALVLVISAGLLVQTFYRLFAADPGFNPEHVLTFQVSLPASKYADVSKTVAFYKQALERLDTVQGVESAGLAEIAPMSGATESTGLRIPDRPPATQQLRTMSNYTIISPGYFASVGTPILRGRDFLNSDTGDSAPVSIINSAMAKKFWPGEDAIGKHVGPGLAKYPMTTIVGIVPDTKHLSLGEEPPPEVYVPFTQPVWPSMLTMSMVVRTKSDPAAIIGSMRPALSSIDPDLPVADLATLKSVVDDSMGGMRFALALLGAFGVLALLLACVGMYGVVSYSVKQRSREIGIRVALGAKKTEVFGMVLGQGARIAVIGIVIGVMAAGIATRLLTTFLYGVRAADPLTCALVSAVLFVVTVLACYLPARRAMAVDPMEALRCE